MSLDQLNRLEELENLIQWTKRKRISPNVRKHYLALHYLSEQSLKQVRLAHPIVVELAFWLRCFNTMIFPHRKYSKGYAAKYRLSSPQNDVHYAAYLPVRYKIMEEQRNHLYSN